jgi:hypothetical protein
MLLWLNLILLMMVAFLPFPHLGPGELRQRARGSVAVRGGSGAHERGLGHALVVRVRPQPPAQTRHPSGSHPSGARSERVGSDLLHVHAAGCGVRSLCRRGTVGLRLHARPDPRGPAGTCGTCEASLPVIGPPRGSAAPPPPSRHSRSGRDRAG